MITWILIVISGVYMNSSAVTFQEFTSKGQCEYVAGLLFKEKGVIKAYCVKK
jgi:hypothetical protein